MVHNEENIIVDCEVSTMVPDDVPDLLIPDVDVVNNVIVQAVPFMNRLSDFDSSSDVFEILTSPDAPFFQISSIGTMVSNVERNRGYFTSRFRATLR